MTFAVSICALFLFCAFVCFDLDANVYFTPTYTTSRSTLSSQVHAAFDLSLSIALQFCCISFTRFTICRCNLLPAPVILPIISRCSLFARAMTVSVHQRGCSYIGRERILLSIQGGACGSTGRVYASDSVTITSLNQEDFSTIRAVMRVVAGGCHQILRIQLRLLPCPRKDTIPLVIC
jgi:hypothetical protein